ncbi:hypothetical protein AAG570_004880 [Ranatra chinensis]|uniref:Uncharacterized protein n=1 Tax=Ranatra chinensis TaxID=642074 RepID=A0ABD0XYT5_9HEMI
MVYSRHVLHKKDAKGRVVSSLEFTDPNLFQPFAIIGSGVEDMTDQLSPQDISFICNRYLKSCDFSEPSKLLALVKFGDLMTLSDIETIMEYAVGDVQGGIQDNVEYFRLKGLDLVFYGAVLLILASLSVEYEDPMPVVCQGVFQYSEQGIASSQVGEEVATGSELEDAQRTTGETGEAAGEGGGATPVSKRVEKYLDSVNRFIVDSCDPKLKREYSKLADLLASYKKLCGRLAKNGGADGDTGVNALKSFSPGNPFESPPILWTIVDYATIR